MFRMAVCLEPAIGPLTNNTTDMLYHKDLMVLFFFQVPHPLCPSVRISLNALNMTGVVGGRSIPIQFAGLELYAVQHAEI